MASPSRSARMSCLRATLLLAAALTPVVSVSQELTEAQIGELVGRSSKAKFAGVDAALARCPQTSAQFTIPALIMGGFASGSPTREGTAQVDVQVLRWTGSCSDGRREGAGEIEYSVRETSQEEVFTLNFVAQGTFVRGKIAGMTCFPNSSIGFRDQAPRPLYPAGTCVLDQRAHLREPDGRWVVMNSGPGGWQKTTSSLDAGSLEAMSEHQIRQARGGASAQPAPATQITSSALTDLVGGMRLTLASTQIRPTSALKGKRIAIVLSSATLTELEKFRAQRELLLAATANASGESARARSDFARASDPRRLLDSLSTFLRSRAAAVTAADDLGTLSTGQVDYAVIFDWKPHNKLDLLGRFNPEPNPSDWGKPDRIVMGEASTLFIVDRNLSIVFRSDMTPIGRYRYGGRECSAGTDCDYLRLLASAFGQLWDPADPDNIFKIHRAYFDQ